MKFISFYLIISLTSTFLSLCGQTVPFHEEYEQYREQAITERRFKHQDIKSLIEKLPAGLFKVGQAGASVQGREIYHIQAGSGEIKVLLWSQMHGNEPTATMALFDIFNYLTQNNSADRNLILSKLQLHFIPMLNPDGADAFQRRNALDIDINRDALRLTSPESRILKTIRDRIEPQWGFNLHDQNRYTSAGKTDQMASISFLAPAFNEEKDWNEGRTDAMQLICEMNETLQRYIPGKIGRYSDEFEPRAFGDNIQKWGTNTILIETGALSNDPEKQYLRQLNYIALLTALKSIATQSYEKYELKDYQKIPFNQQALFDLIVRNASLEMFDQQYLFDIGIRQDEIQDKQAESFHLKAAIADLGDLHNYYGYEEFDASGMTIRYEKLYDQPFTNLEALQRKNPVALVRKGYTTFILETLPDAAVRSRLPYKLIRASDKFIRTPVRLGENPALTFWKENTFIAILANGNFYKLNDDEENR